MYTTLSPCDMCTGACILYKVARVVIGENETFLGGEEYLRQRGIEVVVLKHTECRKLMEEFIKVHPELWYVQAVLSLREYRKVRSNHSGAGMRTSQSNYPVQDSLLSQIFGHSPLISELA